MTSEALAVHDVSVLSPQTRILSHEALVGAYFERSRRTFLSALAELTSSFSTFAALAIYNGIFATAPIADTTFMFLTLAFFAFMLVVSLLPRLFQGALFQAISKHLEPLPYKAKLLPLGIKTVSAIAIFAVIAYSFLNIDIGDAVPLILLVIGLSYVTGAIADLIKGLTELDVAVRFQVEHAQARK
jgi:hypothetical protein